MRVQAGMRFEDTKWKAKARYEGENDAPWVTQSGGYHDLLPSASLAYDLNSDLKLRLAYNKSIGRPDGNDLAQAESAPNDNGDINRGNPDLKPRHSDNYDAALEYYLDDGNSLFSVGYFHKDIKDEIFSGVGPETAYGGNYLQNMNAGEAEARGFEISFVKNSFDFLPGPLDGLGFSANYTRTYGKMNMVDSDGNTIRTVNRLKNQADHTFNAALLYSKDDLNMRLAYKYTSGKQYKFDTSKDTAGRYTDDRFYAPYQQWDFHIGYKVLDNLELYADVFNITDENFKWEYSNGRLLEDQDHGRTVWVGLNYKFQ
jgi:TonB-dependent receptor